MALLTPVLVTLSFAAVQAALWNHAHTEARVIARDTATLVARGAVPADDAAAAATGLLAEATAVAGRTDQQAPQVAVVIDDVAGWVQVTVIGRAPGILIGTAAPISVTEAVPIEDADR